MSIYIFSLRKTIILSLYISHNLATLCLPTIIIVTRWKERERERKKMRIIKKWLHTNKTIWPLSIISILQLKTKQKKKNTGNGMHQLMCVCVVNRIYKNDGYRSNFYLFISFFWSFFFLFRDASGNFFFFAFLSIDTVWFKQ